MESRRRTGRLPNRLARETSPYLRQHAYNPVDWYPWGDEAFGKARREEKPVFLSIGYSSCHWCHVMERESFEDEGLSALLNERFVAIKVDREERPDIDDVYMTAVQLTSGRGGWPLSAFLLPDRRPFFAGTYFPPDDRNGRVGFRSLLLRMDDVWRTRRGEVEAAAEHLAGEIARSQDLASAQGAETLSKETLPLLTAALTSAFDERHGGIGGAPKFPPHLAIAWLLERGVGGDTAARGMALKTLEAMALGGIHDHLGGGFHRYSTDEEWLLPHFEKMLTDNAQLLGLYARAWAITGDSFFARVARSTGDYLLREMRGAEGGFFAATDADSDGEEGKFFTWSFAGIRELLGESDGSLFCKWYEVRPEGNFRDEASGRPTGLNVLHLSQKIPADAEARLSPMRAKLLAMRSRRVPPSLDDKRVAGWNALVVSGFAVAGKALGEPRYLDAARGTARFLLETMHDSEGRLLRSWKEGSGTIPAFLEDEAYLANALLDLSETVPEPESGLWLEEAQNVVESVRRRFRRASGPGFSFSGEGNEPLLAACRDFFDKATPSASGSAALALVRLARKSGDAALAQEASDALGEVSWLMSRSPHGMESWFFALRELLEFEKEYRGERRRESSSNERDAGRTAEAISADGVLTAFFPSKHRAKRGKVLHIPVTFEVKEGWHLQGEDGLRIEAWGGSDFTFEEMRPRPNATVPGEKTALPAFLGSFKADLSFSVSSSAPKGERKVSVVARYRACGEGACRPEATLSLMVPLEIV
ncbi:MAG: thioredoxin domain-containing protein [Thermoanaerobaculia bacterium]